MNNNNYDVSVNKKSSKISKSITKNDEKYYTPSSKQSTISKYYTPSSKRSTISKNYTPPRSKQSTLKEVKKNSKSNSLSTKTSINSRIYNYLSTNIKFIIDKISKKPNIKKSSSNVFITDKNIKQIKHFFKKYTINEKYTLDNRVKYYKYLLNYIKDIKNNECIKKYTENNDIKYSIDNKLFLIKRIGTKSVNAVIYLTIIKNILGGNLLASKLMPNTKDNLREINIMKRITEDILYKKKSKHFLMMYKRFICPPISGRDILNMISNPLTYNGKNNISSDKKLVSINELAHGDLKMIIENKDVLSNDELLFNILIQTFISIATFQNLVGYYHNDAHYGNFLYQKNKEKGYYHYKYNTTDYYLKACEYNIMIYDFGYSTKSYKKYNKKILLDYLSIINAFMNKSSGWGMYYDLPNPTFNNSMIYIKDALSLAFINKDKDNDIENIIIKNILIKTLELNYPHFNIFTTDKPNNIINELPYIIG